jgi:hypothetical protein
MESKKNYYTDEREFVVRFVFRHKSFAKDFILPKQYRRRFILNNIISEDGSDFVRVAQIKFSN